jgi:hypothetical protein
MRCRCDNSAADVTAAVLMACEHSPVRNAAYPVSCDAVALLYSSACDKMRCRTALAAAHDYIAVCGAALSID